MGENQTRRDLIAVRVVVIDSGSVSDSSPGVAHVDILLVLAPSAVASGQWRNYLWRSPWHKPTWRVPALAWRSRLGRRTITTSNILTLLFQVPMPYSS